MSVLCAYHMWWHTVADKDCYKWKCELLSWYYIVWQLGKARHYEDKVG